MLHTPHVQFDCNYYIGQTGSPSQSQQLNECDFLLFGWTTEKGLPIENKKHNID